ncbi:penicillin-binding protein 1C [Treponema sp. UBA3813]|uniref:penicillin-binding protein 1C n=1 Tax=Treponema sp. UBA3813 TaxID=1947715 RepID=UPI0025F4B8B1|nr:penicillin-binding protein 1C [Treponema sp. UBA3813]
MTRINADGRRFLKKKVLFLIFIFSLFLFFFLFLRFSPYPALTEFKARPISTRIYDAEGKFLQITALENGVRREFLPLEEIPPFVQKTFIEAEDRHFYSHHGLDFAAIARAAFQNASEGRTVSGASTITMQLARIIKPNQKRNLLVKITEALDALRLEARLSKSEILELYLNNLPFGFNTEGVASAGRTFFSKEIKDLNELEAACLAVIPRRPSLYNPLTNPENCAKAAFELLQNEENTGLTIEELEKAAAKARLYRYPFEAPHFIRYLSNQSDSPIGKASDIHTTLILSLQHRAEDMLSRAVERYAENRLSNGAILVCDSQTGAIRTWVGSADFFDEPHQGQVDGVLSFQQPGSSMKPFLYALALESGFSPSSVLPDIPMEFGFENLYVPQNFNNRFNGPVRFRVALASSLNIPAVYLLNEIGTEKYLKKLRDLGFASLEKADAGLSLALGGADVSIFEMTQAFSVFVRDGLFLPLYGIEEERFCDRRKSSHAERLSTSPKRIFDMNTARLISDILSDKEARALGFGYSQTFNTPFPAMFKTGTANQYQNITALAATPHYTVGVWMGNFSGETVVGKTGSSIPAKIARDLLVDLQGISGKGFQKPAQFKKERVCALSGMKASSFCPDTVSEYVANEGSASQKEKCSWHTEKGTVYPAEYATWFRLKNRSGIVDDKGSPLKIISPRNGSTFYYDQSIRKDQQKLIVEASGGSADIARFFVDGKFFCESRRPFIAQVPLKRGKQKISVQCGEESTEIEITVK